MLVALAAAVGAVLRYLVDRVVPLRSLPVGTIVVNTSGSFALGVVSAATHGTLATVLSVGVLGGYTTLSTFGVETIALLERRRLREAVLNVLVSAGLGLAAVAVGLALGRAVS